MAKETPLQAMKRLYQSKEKLIDKVIDVAREADEEKDEVVQRLSTVSNKKLLRLAVRRAWRPIARFEVAVCEGERGCDRGMRGPRRRTPSLGRKPTS